MKVALIGPVYPFRGGIAHHTTLLAQALQERGFRLVSGGTDNHLILCDLTKTGVTGKEAETALDQADITLNKNLI